MYSFPSSPSLTQARPVACPFSPRMLRMRCLLPLLAMAILLPFAGHGAPQPIFEWKLNQPNMGTEFQWPDNDIEKLSAVHDGSIPFAVYPRISFPAQGQALVQWQSTQPGTGIVAYGTGKALDKSARSQTSGSNHSILLKGLKPKTNYRYRVVMETTDGGRQLGDIQTLGATMNFSPERPASPADTTPAIRKYADAAISAAPDIAGYIFIFGLRDGSLAAELASKSKFHIIAADTDAQKVNTVRQRFYEEGLLGHRISVLHVEHPAKLPWASCMADVILSETEVPTVSASEVARLQRPKGGVVLLPNGAATKQWAGSAVKLKPAGKYLAAKRGDLAGSTDWTHQYGNSGNTTFTDEALGGVDATGDLKLQWIGQPGGDFGIDRNPRMPAPLSANGRLFHQGMNRVIALNAYNGGILWSMEIPNLRRVNIPQDCSNWATDGNHLYVAIHERVWVIDAKTGKLANTLRLPARQREDHDWGFIAQHGGILVGSSVGKAGIYQNFWSRASWYDGVGSKNAIAKVCSDSLFGYRKADAKGIWAYEKGLIINSTISVHDGKIYFLENRNAELRKIFTGRTPDRRLWLDLKTVCLDAATGKVLWQKPTPPLAHLTADQGFVQVAYGLGTKNGYLTVLSEGRVANGKTTKQGDFQLTLYDGRGGKKWHSTVPWRKNHHGAHIAHPVATEDYIYMDPHIINIATGKTEGRFGPRAGCPTIVASRNALIFRTTNTSTGPGWGPLGLWSMERKDISRIDRLRPSCWLNFVPSQGMLLVPEGGGGCSCGGWMETSVGFLPSLSENKQRNL